MRIHATRHLRRAVTLGGLSVLLTGGCVPRALADDSPPLRAVLRVPLNDRLTPKNLARLTAQSATARDLLAHLERVPDAIITVRAHPRLVQSERLLGQGRFWMVGHRLFALLEYQAEPAGSHRALRVLAHELAHALEVGMLPRNGDLGALRSQLQLRELDEGFAPAPGIETDFARAVSYRVHQEIWRRVPAEISGLLAQAGVSHVALPPLSDAAQEGR